MLMAEIPQLLTLVGNCKRDGSFRNKECELVLIFRLRVTIYQLKSLNLKFLNFTFHMHTHIFAILCYSSAKSNMYSIPNLYDVIFLGLKNKIPFKVFWGGPQRNEKPPGSCPHAFLQAQRHKNIRKYSGFINC